MVSGYDRCERCSLFVSPEFCSCARDEYKRRIGQAVVWLRFFATTETTNPQDQAMSLVESLERPMEAR